MMKITELNALQKNCDIDYRYCNIISEQRTDDGEKCFRILENDGKYYFQEMQHYEVVNCFEVAVDWKSDKFTLYSFTPDGKHIYRIDDRFPSRIDHIYTLNNDCISDGMQCEYNGVKITYISDDEITVNNTKIPVEYNSKYKYKLLKKKIYAIGGAKGLFAFLDNIAEYGKVEKIPLFREVYSLLQEKYCSRGGLTL